MNQYRKYKKKKSQKQLTQISSASYTEFWEKLNVTGIVAFWQQGSISKGVRFTSAYVSGKQRQYIYIYIYMFLKSNTTLFILPFNGNQFRSFRPSSAHRYTKLKRIVTRSAHLFQVIWGPIYTNIKIYKQSTVSMSWYNM